MSVHVLELFNIYPSEEVHCCCSHNMWVCSGNGHVSSLPIGIGSSSFHCLNIQVLPQCIVTVYMCIIYNVLLLLVILAHNLEYLWCIIVVELSVCVCISQLIRDPCVLIMGMRYDTVMQSMH